MEKCQEKKKHKTDHLQLDKDEDKEEAGVQIKPYPARCSQKGPTVANGMPQVSAPAHRPPPVGGAGMGSPSHHLAVVVLSDCPLHVPILFGPPMAPMLPLHPPLLPSLLPVPLVL